MWLKGERMMTASHDLDDFKTEGESSANSIRYRKISAIRRTLWWLGLLLLSPAPAAFITEDGVYLFFRSFPCQMHVESTADPQLLPTLIEKRIVIALSLGFLCWIMCVALSLFSPQSGVLSRKQRSKRILKRIFITIISFIFLFTSIYIYILFNIGIDLYYHPIPV